MAEMICAGFFFAGVVSWVSYSIGRHKGYMEACEDIVKPQN